MTDPSALLAFARQWWPRFVGVAATVLLEIIVAVGLIAIGVPSNPGLGVLAAAVSLTLVYWWATTQRPPRCKKGKIGFAVAITCEDEATQKTVRADFVQDLRRQVEASSSGDKFVFVVIPHHLAEKADSRDKQRKLFARTRCHFFLAGQVRHRQIGEKKKYFVTLQGTVRHRTLSAPAQEGLQKEFNEVIPGRVDFEENVSLLGFEITSLWAHVSAKYIIALAMALSGFLSEADHLFAEVEGTLPKLRGALPAFKKIRKSVPEIRAAMRVSSARRCYERWRDTDHDPARLDEMAEWLDGAKVLENTRVVLNYRAILAFLRGRHCSTARELLNQFPPQLRDALWHFNQGFLYAYEGKLEKADKHYLVGSRLPLPPETAAELELFMAWVAAEEPDRFELYYVLGQLNQTLKGDSQSALRDFQSFLKLVPPDKHLRAQQRVRKRIDELSVELGIEGRP